MRVGKWAFPLAIAVAALTVACSSPAGHPATPATTATTVDPAAAGQSQTAPADFPAQFKVPPGFAVVSFQFSGAAGGVERRLSGTWIGSGDPPALFPTETSLLLEAGWTIDGVVGRGKSLYYDRTGFFRVAGFGWVGLGDVSAVSATAGHRSEISVQFHQPGIDTPIS